MRAIMIFILIIIWVGNFYVFVRTNFFFISFWAISFQIAALFTLSASAGRLVVEKQLVQIENDKLQLEFTNKGKSFDLENDGIKHLPEEDRNQLWRFGIWSYSIAVPFVWISAALFYTTNMDNDILCSLAIINGLPKDQY